MGDDHAMDDIAGHIAKYVILLSDTVDNITGHIKFLDNYVDHSWLRSINGIAIT